MRRLCPRSVIFAPEGSSVLGKEVKRQKAGLEKTALGRCLADVCSAKSGSL